MKKYLWIIIPLALALVIGVAVAIAPKDTAAQEVSYQEVAVKKGDIAVSFSTDAVVQGELVSITAPVSEKITEMKVAVGTEVKAGQHLFTIDKTKLQYQYNAAMATFSKAVYERNQIDQTLKPDAYSAAQQVVNSTYSQVQIAKLALDQTYVKSPVAGIVAEVNVHAGEYPAAGQSAIVKIVKKGSLSISTVLDEAEVGKITRNTPVTIALDALGKKAQGKIISIAPMAIKDSAGYSVYPVVISLTDKTLAIKVGFEGSVQFITKTVSDVLQIPVSAVFVENGKSFVNEKTADGNSKTEIVTGFTDGKVVEVTSGLTSDSIVLIKK
jgi:HlyD family secretion protein